jgi:NADPH:quinone reductase-like Zn-dependent oxidoreductase
MKAIVLHEYGAPSKLKLEEVPDPQPGPGEVLVRVAAASINPIDFKLRSGVLQDYYPLELPEILGRDLSGTVRAIGEGVTSFAPGDKVFALANHTYAELCVVKASDLAKVPEGLGLVEAAALPLVMLTGEQLIRLGAKIQSGQTVLVTGALGGVGRSAVYIAKQSGATVIAGVRTKQLADAKSIGADHVLALDDKHAMEQLGLLDAVADTVGHSTATALLAHVKPGGNFGSALGPVVGSELHPNVIVNEVSCIPDTACMVRMANAVIAKKLLIPIDRMIALADAAKGQAAAENGGIGKVLLLA